MENIKDLLKRLWPSSGLILVGIILIVYLSLGFLFLQQGSQQEDLKPKIEGLKVIVSRSVPDIHELQEEVDRVRNLLTPMEDPEAIALLVKIAEASGIDITEEGDRFRVPSATTGEVVIDGVNYHVTAFYSINVQGDKRSVMTFLTNLDQGTYLETMVLDKVILSEVEVIRSEAELDRRAEFRAVISSVDTMMQYNNIERIPNPIDVDGGIAVNTMGDLTNTPEIVEGFPDVTTTPAQKGYTGDEDPRDGYVLYDDDVINPDKKHFSTISYYPYRETDFYYTCESDGTVRQWSGPDLETAIEYRTSEVTNIETKATIDVVIYSKG